MSTGQHKIDLWILIPVLMLIGMSFGVVYSASSSWSAKMSGDSSMLFKNHVLRAGIGIFCIFLFSRIDYRSLINFRKLLIVVVFALLAYLIVSNIEATKGAVRWIKIAGVSFQPADFVKYVLVLNIAYMLADKRDYIWSLYFSYLPMLFYVLVVCTLIALQPNISTAIMIFVTCMLMFYIGKVKIKHIVFTVVSVLPVALLYIWSKTYALNRLFAFAGSINGEESNYQLSQAIIGFGNGFIFGVGPGNSNQKEFFLPQSYDDFVFAILGEEYGYFGTVLVIVLFALFIYKGFKVAKKMDDDFGKYFAFGITAVIAMNAVVNMMVSTGIIPTTGVTLPFISYGGTSIIFNSIAVGILLNISTHRTDFKPGWVEDNNHED
jgi:cell division protein FtsW